MTLDLIEKYFNSNDDYYYFNALEFIRQLIDTKFNNSIIKAKNVYRLYTDRKRAKDIYKIKLPSVSFIDDYLKAFRETNAVERKKILNKFFNIVKNDIEVVPIYNRAKDLDIDEIKLGLVTLNNLVCYVEDLILNNHPYSIPLYFITINDLDRFIRDTLEVLPPNYEELVKEAKIADDQEERIRALEDLFMVVDSKYKMDYDNFCIKRYSYKTTNV